MDLRKRNSSHDIEPDITINTNKRDMKVKFKIESNAFIRYFEVDFDWNLPMLPRKGEIVSPNIIMLSKIDIESTLNDLSTEGKRDCEGYLDGEQEKNDAFYSWLWEVICEVNMVKSVHYEIDKEDCFQVFPVIYLSDK